MASLRRDACGGLPHVLNIITLLFLCLSCGLVSWSTSDVTDVVNGASGTAEIGIWKACSDIDPDTSLVFSPKSTCRQGHCTIGETIAGTSTRSDESLCDRASAVGAFSILAIFCVVASMLVTTFRAVMARTVLWWKGALYCVLGAFFSMIAWAIWARWQGLMNDQTTSTSDRIQFGDFDYGAGFGLQVASFIFMCINAYMCRHNAQEQARNQVKMRHTTRERLNTSGMIDTLYDEQTQDVGSSPRASGLDRPATKRRAPGEDVIVMTRTEAL